MGFKFLQGGVKFRAHGKALNESFENSALALTNKVYKKRVKSVKNKKIRVYGRNLNKLLSNFLEKVLGLMEVYDFLISDVKSLKIFGTGLNLRKRKYELEAEFSGDDIENYDLDFDTKKISYFDILVNQENVKGKNVFVCEVAIVEK